jgi:oxygen-independent coproporphyrinogen-3 oxidase
LANRFSLAADSEVSLEANPEDWSPELAASLRAAGFNRVSFGAQSFDPRVLSALGRNHKPLDIVDAVAIARRAGFDSVNLDLIFGTPSETLSDWQRTLEEALDLVPDHLSLYALTVERGTALSRAVMAGAAAPDADLQADQYELACRMAGEAGLHRYEVSNWARPGHECRYNLSVWGQGEYLAFGNGAHGHRDGVRRHNPARVQAYMEKIESGHRSDAGNQTISGWAAEQERLLLGLRRSAGVICGRSGAAVLASEWGRRLAAAGILARQEDRLVITRPLLTDEVSRAVLALSPVEC